MLVWRFQYSACRIIIITIIIIIIIIIIIHSFLHLCSFVLHSPHLIGGSPTVPNGRNLLVRLHPCYYHVFLASLTFSFSRLRLLIMPCFMLLMTGCCPPPPPCSR